MLASGRPDFTVPALAGFALLPHRNLGKAASPLRDREQVRSMGTIILVLVILWLFDVI